MSPACYPGGHGYQPQPYRVQVGLVLDFEPPFGYLSTEYGGHTVGMPPAYADPTRDAWGRRQLTDKANS